MVERKPLSDNERRQAIDKLIELNLSLLTGEIQQTT